MASRVATGRMYRAYRVRTFVVWIFQKKLPTFVKASSLVSYSWVLSCGPRTLLVVLLRPKRGRSGSRVSHFVIVTPTSFLIPVSRSAIGTDIPVETVLRPIEGGHLVLLSTIGRRYCEEAEVLERSS